MPNATDSSNGSGRSGLLSVVGTPIGNLGDASPRMVETLRLASVVYCEDTRVTARLLARFDVRVPLRRADENVLDARVDEVLGRVAAGERVAFVSDAGMPGVSDPGQRLVDAALDAGLAVEVVPGPSAVTAALVASGLPMRRFLFEGFLPRRAGILETRLRELASVPATLVVYESPRRVASTLEVVARVLPGRRVALVRELTKVHEEVVRGSAEELATAVAARGEVRGECVVVIGPPAEGSAVSAGPSPSLDDEIRAGLASGEAKSDLARRLAKAHALTRASIYDRVLKLAGAGRTASSDQPL